MESQSAASAYQEASFEHAPPLKIIHLMYAGALRFLDQAAQIDPQPNPEEFSDRLRRADAVVAELRMSLDHEVAPELCRDLSALYLFVERRIQDALLERTRDPLEGARDILVTLQGAWSSIEMPRRLAG